MKTDLRPVTPGQRSLAVAAVVMIVMIAVGYTVLYR
jgi:hypothetical protein